jgi:hypothetical protein
VRTLASLAFFIAATLAGIAGVVLGLGDAQTLTSPPEARVEGFVREMMTARYEQAKSYLSDELAAQTDAARLKALSQAWEKRTGMIEDVRGEPGWIKDDQAEAFAALQTKGSRQWRLKFKLSRHQGVWSLDDLGRAED